jgi:regulator of protease activity HflC (stomatin/prohibitin superfamily)
MTILVNSSHGNLIRRTAMATPREVGDALRQYQTDMPSSIQWVVFVVLVVISLALAGLVHRPGDGFGVLAFLVLLVLSGLVASAIKVANQWQRGVVLRLGELHGTRGPGLFLILPVIDRVRMIDTRILAHHISEQAVITRDNVPVTIDSVLFYRVTNAEDAVVKIQDFAFAIAQLAQSALRDVVGGMTLDELLAEREQIAHQIEQHVETDSREWGLHVTGIRLQDIGMPEELKRIMSRQAGAEREKRATITKAEGDKLAAENLAAAATIMSRSAGAMQLRTLQTIDGLGPSASNTVLLAVPIELMEFVRKLNPQTGP